MPSRKNPVQKVRTCKHPKPCNMFPVVHVRCPYPKIALLDDSDTTQKSMQAPNLVTLRSVVWSLARPFLFSFRDT
jgi:hypothetical protein